MVLSKPFCHVIELVSLVTVRISSCNLRSKVGQSQQSEVPWSEKVSISNLNQYQSSQS